MANRYDIIYRGKGVECEGAVYRHEGEIWAFYKFERRGETEADACIAGLVAQGYEAKRVYAGKPRSRDLDD